MNQMDLICCIVNDGLGSRVLHAAKQNGVPEGVIFLGMGTAHNKWLRLLDLADVHREVVYLLADRTLSSQVMRSLCKEFSLEKPYHGIVYSMQIAAYVGAAQPTEEQQVEIKAVDKIMNENMFNVIYAVVEKGRAEEAVEAAAQAGARGGTIINARGSGVNENQRIFAMPIEPEKESVMILVKRDICDKVRVAICEKLQIGGPGGGILFVIPVNEAHGVLN